MAKSPAWQRKEGKNPKGGLNAKGRASYNAANPGKPGLKAPQPEGGSRKKSFCARSADMVDEIQTARELATHANDIKHLQDDMDAMKEDIAAIRASLESINKTLSEAKGGWKVLMMAGGAISAITAIVGFFTGKMTS